MLLSHPDRLRNTDPGQSGFTLLEVVVAISVLAIGLLGLASFLVSTTHQREEIVAGNRVLNEAESLMETILAITPHSIQTTFDEETYEIEGVTGDNPDGSALSVSVVYEETSLVRIVVSASWTVRGRAFNSALTTQVWDPDA